jgi:hypothetical protein
MKRWIIFKTASASSQGWKERKLKPAGHLTRILAEYLDCSDQVLPELSYRPREFACSEESVYPNFPDASTHVRWSNWEVIRIERFKSIDAAEYDEIVVCYCSYSPIEPEWKELPTIGALQEGKL